MTRSFMAVVVLGVAGFALAPAILEGCSQTGVGDPCTPEQEYDPTFNGFDPGEVNVESKSFQCQTRLCLVNHFQGRVSCPYGQIVAMPSAITTGQCSGQGLMGGTPSPTYPTPAPGTGTCAIPGASTIIGDSSSSAAVLAAYQVQVAKPLASGAGFGIDPQVTPRQTANTVYCSCRCANTSGATDDGSVYCSCPSGFYCAQLVTSIGSVEQGLTGGYCIKGDAPGASNDTAYDPAKLAGQEPCAPPPPGSTMGGCPLPE